MRVLHCILLGFLSVAVAAGASAETAAQKGTRIARMADQSDDGYGDLVVDGEMILKTAQGQQSKRRFTTKTLEGRGNSAQMTVLEFEWPGDIRDTALLTHSYDGRADDQWLYLPSVGRVKKVTGAGRTGSFVGSEFTYEDMVDQEAGNYSHTWVSDGKCPTGQGTCHVLSRVPKHRSGYSRQVAWIDTSEYRYQTVQFYDRRGQLLKTLTFAGYRKYKGRFWRPSRMIMVNHLTGKSTTLNWSNYRFNVGLSPSEFSRNALTR